MTWRYCAMKSISTMPPAAYFRSQISPSPFSSATARRMSATSVAIACAWRGRVSTSRMVFSILARNAGAGQRHMLPGPGLMILIFGERLDMRGYRPCPPRGTQPHVDVVEHAVIGPRGERADQSLGEAREIMRALQRSLAVGIRMLGIEVK